MESAVTSEIADTTTATPVPVAKKTTVLKKFKNVVSAVIRAPGKFISYIGKEKPTKAAVEENVTAEAETVEVATKEVEPTLVTAEKETEVVAKDPKEAEVIAEKIETAKKESEAPVTVKEKEVAPSSDDAPKPSVVA